MVELYSVGKLKNSNYVSVFRPSVWLLVDADLGDGDEVEAEKVDYPEKTTPTSIPPFL